MFDGHCVLRSETAMLTGRPDWASSVIANGTVRVGQQDIPIGVVSATIGENDGARLVISTPTLWRAGGVPPGNIGLDRLMSAVFMHEATHVFQMDTYGRRIQSMVSTYNLSDAEFNDDAIQTRFKNDTAFASSIQREIAMFFAAADADQDEEALRLATAARQMMKERAARYFVGDQAYQREAEDLWLTMEGSAQWAGYRWLQLPIIKGGAGLTDEAAREGFGRRGDYWTQQLGLAITLTVERLDEGGWKRHLFGDGRLTLLELLDRNLDTGGASPT